MRTLLVFFILAVVLSIGCSQPKQYVDCERILDRDERIDCRYNLTVSNLDSSKCKEIGNVNLSRTCINEIALALGAEHPCYEHSRASDRDRCLDAVALSQRRN
jgi:hypothetical protein